ncbi:MAG: 50S ribosomal protein L11 methyltransferase [Nitrospirae bacterium]|nr:50S ribosomal protein L11 methyltransferase [Nitrospirota bacterium]
MEYYEFIIIVPDASRDALMYKLKEMGSPGLYEDGAVLRAYFENMNNIDLLCGELNAFRDVLRSSGLDPSFTFTHSVLPAQDWNEAWKKSIAPINAGNAITIIPPWETAEAGRIIIMIDSGMAFGTGHHETTKTCLAHIEKISKGHAGKSLLDIGTGTGILAIGASKMGFTHIVAVDTDPLSVDAARKNAGLNGSENIEVKEGSISEAQGTFDVIIANLISGTLIEIAPEVASHLNPDGIVVLSGMLAGEEDMVADAYMKAGLDLKEKYLDGNWVTLVVSPALNF